MIRESAGDRAYIVFVHIILAIVGMFCVFPILVVISMSITPFEEVLRNGGFLIIPRKITFEAYGLFLSRPRIPEAYKVTVFITVVGTTINLIVTSLMAYSLSRKSLPGRKILLYFVLIPLLFSGGLIPNYLVVKSIGLLNSIWALILPLAAGSFNVIVMRTFFERMDQNLIDAANIDGAGEFRTFIQVVLPVSMPAIAAIGLFYAVNRWNTFLEGVMYITDSSKHPLQVVLRSIIVSSTGVESDPDITIATDTLKMSAVVLTALPVVILYPLLQKHFVKGMLLGSLKE